jgi:hypothetical protein
MSIIEYITLGLEWQRNESRAALIASLERAGATSPATARSLDELRVTTDEFWAALVREGRVREGPPNQYYLYDAFAGRPRGFRKQRLIKMIVFYIVILALPILLVLFESH